MAKKYLDDTGMSYFWGKLKAYFQEKLVSGTNIKTINSTSLLGSGDIELPSPADYVVEEGTSEIWTYRKWDSGIAECWGSVETTTNFAVWSSPIYYGTTYCARQNFPTGLFIAVPREYVSIIGEGMDTWTGTEGDNKVTTTQTGRYYPLRAGSAGTQKYITQFYDVGKWK